MPDFWKRAILHVDMDAFYCSVEQLDNPALRGKPVIVAGAPESRGVVAAASYEVRPYGVRSAMPTSQALRLCPHAIRVDPRMERYEEVSDRVFEVFAEMTPLVEGASLDEAFLDVTGSQRLLGEPVVIARRIKNEIRARTGLTASVGVSTCRFVAKIASDMEKPDGLVVIPEGEAQKRLSPLPVGKLWGVGPQTNQRLASLGIHHVADLIAWPPEELHRQLGDAGPSLRELALGIDPSPVVSDAMEKSVSNEITFERDINSREALSRELLRLSDQVAARLRRRGLGGRVVQLKLRYDDFTTLTRQVTLPSPARTGRVLHQAARRLMLERTDAGRRAVRLIGVGVAGLETAEGRQVALFDPLGEDAKKTEQAERAVDRIRERMGRDAIDRASLHEGRPTKRRSASHDDSNSLSGKRANRHPEE